jgi:hypothetical protein
VGFQSHKEHLIGSLLSVGCRSLIQLPCLFFMLVVYIRVPALVTARDALPDSRLSERRQQLVHVGGGDFLRCYKVFLKENLYTLRGCLDSQLKMQF